MERAVSNDYYKVDASSRYLQEMALSIKEKDRLQTELDLVLNATQPGAIRYDRDLIQTSPYPDAIPDAVAKMVDEGDYASMLRKGIEDLDRELAIFNMKLLKVKGTGGALLRQHYWLGKPWKQVAREFFLSESSLYRARRAALVELYDNGLPLGYGPGDIRAMD